MGKSRMMGAGNASATLYKCDPNIPTGGGNKKQGITSRVGLDNWENREVQTQSNGLGRFKLFFMNQLGGVEPGHSMFGGRWNRADGLTHHLYTKQLQEVIKQDKQTGIYPGNDKYYLGNRQRYSSSECNPELKFRFTNNYATGPTATFDTSGGCDIDIYYIITELYYDDANRYLIIEFANISGITKIGVKIISTIDPNASYTGLYEGIIPA